MNVRETLLMCIAAFALLLASRVSAQSFDADVAPVLQKHCVGCHGGAKPKAGLALDKVTPDFDRHAEAWKGVLERISDGTMPPKSKARPTAAEVKTVASWAATELSAYQTKKAAAMGRARLRRLNRVEYANTLRDLLGVNVDIEALPEDGIASGFDNVDNALDLSTVLLERYLETADAALEEALVGGAKPRAATRRIEFVPIAKQMTKPLRPIPRFGMSTQILDNEIHLFGANEVSKPILDTKVTQPGLYRVRVSANALNYGKPMPLMFYAGNYGRGVQGLITRPIGVYDVAEKPAVIEFSVRLTAQEALRMFPFGMANIYQTKLAKDYAGPGLARALDRDRGPAGRGLAAAGHHAASGRRRSGQGKTRRRGDRPARLRAARVPPSGQNGRARSLCQHRKNAARQGLHLRGGAARRAQGDPVQSAFSLSRGQPRQAERF